MIPAPFRVVLDANALYPFSLRDTLLRSAAKGLFQAYWSEKILDEAVRNLVDSKTMTEAQAKHLLSAMARAFPEALVAGYEALEAAMKNDEKDRHVAAAAVKAGAQVIVTDNLNDFRDLPDGIEAQSSDEFLCNLFDLDPDGMVELVQDQAADLKKPPRTFPELLGGLAKLVPDFVAAIRGHVEKQETGGADEPPPKPGPRTKKRPPAKTPPKRGPRRRRKP
jgi:predicted nucleic acid-binding protein